MGVIISTPEQVKEYFDSPALGQSSLKHLLKGLDTFLANQLETKEVFYEEKDYLIYGSGVDLILTGQEGQFEKEFHVSNIQNKPSDTIMAICHRVLELLREQFEEEQQQFTDYTMEAFWLDRGESLGYFEQEILRACEEIDYGSKWKPETKISKVMEADPYFMDIVRAQGKTVIDQVQKEKIDSIVMSLTTNPRTAKFFDREMQARQKNMDFYYQLPIYFEYRGIPCKALLDFVAVTKDDEGNILKIEPFDLKTMSGNTLNFYYSVKSRRYDIQAAWYTLALRKMFNLTLQDDIVAPFSFIVESTSQLGNPLVYRLHHSFLSAGTIGVPEVGIGDHIIKDAVKGYEDLLDDYIWYNENGWEVDKRIVETGGVFELGWNGTMN